MSAQTSTKRASTPAPPPAGAEAGMQPWHLFLIMTLLATAAAAVAVRGTSPANVAFICLTVASAGLAAWAVYRTILPLAQPESVEEPEMLGGETRAALERKESRGGHFREDFPDKDKRFGKLTTQVKKGAGGEMVVEHVPVPQWPAELQEIIDENQK